MSLPKMIQLVVWGNPAIVGTGGELELRLPAYRVDRDGNQNWRGEVALKVPRYFVKQFMEQVAQMHQRDRERLARESARLCTEVQAVQIKPGTSQE